MSVSMQEYFDTGLNFMRGQKRQCTDAGHNCVYLNDEGERCVAGNTVPDDMIEELKDIGHLSVGEIIEKFPVLEGTMAPIGPDGIDLALALQELHDETDRPDWIAESGNGLGPQGEEQAKEIAYRFSLAYNPPS